MGLGVPVALALAALLWWRHRLQVARATGTKGERDSRHDIRVAQGSALPLTPFPPDLRSIESASRIEKSPQDGRQNPMDVSPADTAPVAFAQFSREESGAMVTTGSELFSPGVYPHTEEQGVVQHRDEHGIIFQHRDAGLVRELPPPYAESRQRSLPRLKSNTSGSGSTSSRQFREYWPG